MKHPSRKISIAPLLFAILSGLTLFTVISFGSYGIYWNYMNAQEESRLIRETYMAEQKNLIRQEVEKAIDSVHYHWSKTEERLKSDIKTRTLEAWAIADSLYREYAGTHPPDELKKMILDALRPIRFNNGRGYYFATDLNGVEILFADHPELEGKSLIDMKDTKGAYVIRDMIDLVKRNGEGFYRYTWTKPNAPGRDFPKIAYLKYFEPFNGFIGTGEYLDDVEKDIQQEVLARIEKIRFGRDGYIFVVSLEGETLMNSAQPDRIGTNMQDMTDVNGVRVYDAERRAAQKPGGDFITYVWPKPSTGKSAPKLAYVKGFPQWGWMVGAGIYTDAVEETIAENEKAAMKKAMADIYLISAVLAGIMGLVLLLSYAMSRVFRRNVDAFIAFFKEMEQGGTPIDTGRFVVREFTQLADSANAMLVRRQQAEEVLRESEEKLQAIFRAAPVGIGVVTERVFGHVNQRMCEITGYLREELIGRSSRMIYATDAEFERVGVVKYQQIAETGFGSLETEWRKRDGAIITVLLSSTPLDPANPTLGNIFTALDITERKKAEEDRDRLEKQLAQSQKLESVGRLAGGVAHDFNNMLSIVIGYAEMALDTLLPEEPLHANIREILDAALRSATLTRQLLAFARKQTLEMQPLNLNNVIIAFMKMIRRTLRENVKVDTRLAPDLYAILGDIGQIEQVIMNLAVNAHDAMPDGGALSIETANVTIDEAYALTRQDVVPGPYVKMTVSDTGLGMSRGVLEKIFEPFFTTKELGQGTGLGLSTVYGIVKQHGGMIWADSVPEKGATFQVFFPAIKSVESAEATPAVQEDPAHGTETILLVEDQEQVRKMACTLLKRYGYHVMEAPDGQTALALMASGQRTVHLLITDVIMPGMNGKELYERLAATHPGLKVLYMSGYTADIIGHHGRLEAGEQFIQKPFSVKEFARKIREILGD